MLPPDDVPSQLRNRASFNWEIGLSSLKLVQKRRFCGWEGKLEEERERESKRDWWIGNSRGGSARTPLPPLYRATSYRPRGGQARREREREREREGENERTHGRVFSTTEKSGKNVSKKGLLAWAKRDALWSDGYRGRSYPDPGGRDRGREGATRGEGRADERYPRSSGSRVVEGFVNNRAAIRWPGRQGHRRERETKFPVDKKHWPSSSFSLLLFPFSFFCSRSSSAIPHTDSLARSLTSSSHSTTTYYLLLLPPLLPLLPLLN